MRQPTQLITSIRVGRRLRREVGDLRPLMASIREVGLLHPAVVTPDQRLIAGFRRLQACKALGWTRVPVRIVPLDRLVRGEVAENIVRKAFLPSELVQIARVLEPLERAAAHRRRGARGKGGKFPPLEKGKVRDRLARAVGVSGRTLDKAMAVVDAAERAPSKYARLLRRMDATGHIDAAYSALRSQQDADRLRRRPRTTSAVRHCSMQALLSSLREIDVILTDPPYRADALPLYDDLARLAKVALKPDGLLAVMCGHAYLPEVLACMAKHLPYRWTLAYTMAHPRGRSKMWARKILSQWKPVLLFGGARHWLIDLVDAGRHSGEVLHEHGQSERGMLALVERLTRPGDLVVDPFVGSGTTGVACRRLARRFIGADLDAAAVRLAAGRIGALRTSA